MGGGVQNCQIVAAVNLWRPRMVGLQGRLVGLQGWLAGLQGAVGGAAEAVDRAAWLVTEAEVFGWGGCRVVDGAALVAGRAAGLVKRMGCSGGWWGCRGV